MMGALRLRCRPGRLAMMPCMEEIGLLGLAWRYGFRVYQRCRRAGCDERAQMTVELCALLPVAIIVAVIAVNAMTFFSECAEFDRVSRNAVRVHAASPSYGEGSSEASALVAAALDEAFSAENLSCEVSVSSGHQGFSTYEMTLSFSPTLFGMGIRSEVLGVAIPPLKHVSTLTVHPYRPGMLL